MALTFHNILRLIKRGEPVTEGVTNRPLRELKDNVDYVLSLINAADIGEAIFDRDAAVESSASVGMPVYWDADAQEYKKALASVETVRGELTLADAAKVWGVVHSKATTTRADIVLMGLVDIDLSLAVSGDVEAGDYYLSGTTAGNLTTTPAAASVRVLRSDGHGRSFVQIDFRSFLDQHRHYRFELHSRPAGVAYAPEPGDLHVIDVPDSTQPGWLPADDEIFEGNAPAGAKFGYNISQDPNGLADFWPPLPLQHVHFELDRGENAAVGYQGVPPGIDRLIVANRDGIWWMSDCYGDVPWPTTFDSNSSDPDYSDESLVGECPRDLDFSLVLWATKQTFANDKTVVTSLISDDDRLEITCQDDSACGVGDLRARLNLAFALADAANTAGYVVLKGLDDDGKFTRGPIVSGLKTSGDNAGLTGGELGDDGYRRGDLTLSVVNLPSRELPIREVRVDGVTLEYREDIPMLEFPAGKTTRYRGIVKVPHDLSEGEFTLAFRFILLGRTAGTLPALTLSYRIASRPTDGLNTPVDLPTEDTSLAIETEAEVDVDQYVEAVSDSIEVTPGDTIFFFLERAGTLGYAGAVDVLDQYGALGISS